MTSYQSAFLSSIIPEPNLNVNEWAESNRYLSRIASAEPGPWRTDRVPYTKEIMECLSPNSGYEIVVFMKGSQIAGTEVGNNWVGATVDKAPGPFLYVMPTGDTAKKNVKIRLNPLLMETPCLKGRIKDPRSRDSGNTLNSKEYPGGFINIIGANSGSAFRSLPCRYLFLDETDAYPEDVSEEGSPIALAIVRTSTFGHRRKVYLVSSPKTRGASIIEDYFEQTDKRYYHIPCPKCDHYQTLYFKNLKWDRTDYSSTRYICESCNYEIQNHEKSILLGRGEWRSTAKSIDPKMVGFHLSSLYAPVGWLSWEDIAREWDNAQGNMMKLKTFINTRLGETWEERGDAPDFDGVIKLREDYPRNTIPDGGLVLVAAADVQKDRIEVEIKAYGKRLESWSVDHRQLWGDPAQQDVWDRLSAIFEEDFESVLGPRMKIRVLGIDSGGLHTTHVYNWARKMGHGRVLALKGRDEYGYVLGKPTAVDYNWAGQKVRKGVYVWPVGVSLIKTEIYSVIRQAGAQDKPFAYMHYPQYSDEFFRQLVSESLVKKTVNGRTKFRWVIADGKRNEALDLAVYCRALTVYLGLEYYTDTRWKQELEYLQGQRSVQKPRRSRTISRGVQI